MATRHSRSRPGAVVEGGWAREAAVAWVRAAGPAPAAAAHPSPAALESVRRYPAGRAYPGEVATLPGPCVRPCGLCSPLLRTYPSYDLVCTKQIVRVITSDPYSRPAQLLRRHYAEMADTARARGIMPGGRAMPWRLGGRIPVLEVSPQKGAGVLDEHPGRRARPRGPGPGELEARPYLRTLDRQDVQREIL